MKLVQKYLDFPRIATEYGNSTETGESMNTENTHYMITYKYCGRSKQVENCRARIHTPFPSGSWHRNFRYAWCNICGIHNSGKRYDDNKPMAATRSHKVLCTCLLAPVTHYRTFTFPVPRRRRHRRRRPKQSRRNSVASFRSDGYRYQRREVRPARHSSADAFVSKLPDARRVSRQASTAHWFQSSIWRISSADESPPARVC